MQVLAGELVRLHGRAIFGFLAAADVEQNSLVAQLVSAPDEGRMAAENDQVAVPAFGDLRQAFTLGSGPRNRGCVWVETIPQHFLRHYSVPELPSFPRND